MKAAATCLVISLAFSAVSSARILALFPTPSYSHQIVFRAVTTALAERGHELVILTPNPVDNAPPNIQQIDVSFAYQGYFHQINFASTREENIGITNLLQMFTRALEEIVTTELAHPEIQRIIHDPEQHFDVVICEMIGYTPMYAFAEYFGAPLIGFTTTEPTYHEHRAMGNYIHSVLHPMNVFPNYKDLGWVERFAATTLDVVMRWYFEPLVYSIFDRVIEQNFGGNVSRSAVLANNIDMMLLNTHPALDFVRPIVPNTIQLGFLHVKPPQALPAEWQSYLDASKHGVIYFSLGTNVKTGSLKAGTIELLVETFSQLKYDVLWKWDTEEIDLVLPKNVKTTSWVPQQDLLAHPKIKLFVTQGGHQSIEEAIDRGVPMIAIPFFVDQFPNSRRIANKGVGITLDLNDMTVDKFKKNILEVIENPKYKENVVKLSQIIRDQPISSVEKAVWWVEYCIRHHGTAHLRYHGLNIPFYQYYLLDVIAVYLALIITLIFAIRFIKRWFIKRLNALMKAVKLKIN